MSAADVFALDFDGVICDSAAETAVSACRAWYRLTGGAAQDPTQAQVADFCRVRPVLETGYQAVILMRLIVDGIQPERILADFHGLCERFLAETGLERDALVAAFGATRDDWIAHDESGWLARHRFYPGVGAAVAHVAARGHVYILTTKQERFTRALLAAEGVPVPGERIFGLERKRPKEDILRDLLAAPAHRGATVHFVEDRLATLERAAAEPGLETVRLALASWGYVTRADLDSAAVNPRIRVLSLDGFDALLRQGR